MRTACTLAIVAAFAVAASAAPLEGVFQFENGNLPGCISIVNFRPRSFLSFNIQKTSECQIPTGVYGGPIAYTSAPMGSDADQTMIITYAIASSGIESGFTTRFNVYSSGADAFTLRSEYLESRGFWPNTGASFTRRVFSTTVPQGSFNIADGSLVTVIGGMVIAHDPFLDADNFNDDPATDFTFLTAFAVVEDMGTAYLYKVANSYTEPESFGPLDRAALTVTTSSSGYSVSFNMTTFPLTSRTNDMLTGFWLGRDTSDGPNCAQIFDAYYGTFINYRLACGEDNATFSGYFGRYALLPNSMIRLAVQASDDDDLSGRQLTAPITVTNSGNTFTLGGLDLTYHRSRALPNAIVVTLQLMGGSGMTFNEDAFAVQFAMRVGILASRVRVVSFDMMTLTVRIAILQDQTTGSTSSDLNMVGMMAEDLSSIGNYTVTSASVDQSSSSAFTATASIIAMAFAVIMAALF